MKKGSSLRRFLLCAVLAAVAPAWASDLKITRFEIARVEDGHAVFPPDAFAPGETVYFSFHVEGFTRKDNTVKLQFEAQPLDAAGVALTAPIVSEEANTLTPEDKDWHPKLRGSFPLPGVLSGGAYRIALRLKDELSGAASTIETSFVVSGVRIEPSATLVIRNLNFYRNDDDERPLDIAAYRVSEEIHARFQVVGYQHGTQGAINVVYGISIADPSGRVLFAEPAAAEDKSEEFYPKPYVPGILSFHLKPGTPPGEYMLLVTAIDQLGSQKTESHRSFRLE